MTWSKESRAAVGAAVFERFARPVRAFPERHHPLRVARVAGGLTQSELAGAAHVDRAMVSKIERGALAGSPATHRKLADALGCPIDELFRCSL
jgi:DNA-binding XRE family transcriptional regulator